MAKKMSVRNGERWSAGDRRDKIERGKVRKHGANGSVQQQE